MILPSLFYATFSLQIRIVTKKSYKNIKYQEKSLENPNHL